MTALARYKYAIFADFFYVCSCLTPFPALLCLINAQCRHHKQRWKNKPDTNREDGTEIPTVRRAVKLTIRSHATIVAALDVIHLLIQSFQVLGYMNPCEFWCDERTGCLIFHFYTAFKMKQYVDCYGKGTKKVPLPVAVHLIRAVGALTLHTGRNYMYGYGHKKCPQQLWRAFSPLSNVQHCKDGDSF